MTAPPLREAFTRDVMRMLGMGTSLPEIRRWIDDHYEGVPTDTELPVVTWQKGPQGRGTMGRMAGGMAGRPGDCDPQR